MKECNCECLEEHTLHEALRELAEKAEKFVSQRGWCTLEEFYDFKTATTKARALLEGK